MDALIVFRQIHTEFRIPELESVIRILKLNVSYDLSSYSDQVSPN
jgi:tRNA G10  N-methylase Trm11